MGENMHDVERKLKSLRDTVLKKAEKGERVDPFLLVRSLDRIIDKAKQHRPKGVGDGRRHSETLDRRRG